MSLARTSRIKRRPVRVLHLYLIQDFLIMFGLTLLVFTFVMSLGALFKAIDLLAKGVPASVIVGVFLYNIPYVLTFSIPMSTLTSVLLLFGRLSMDGELTAMRASGLSIWQIIAPIIFLSVIFSAVCFWINYEASPRSHFARRSALMNLGEMDPLDLLEEGQFNNEWPGLKIYIGEKNGNKIKDVWVYELGGLAVVRSIRAQSGIIQQDMDTMVMNVDLFDALIDQPDEKHPLDPTKSYHFRADKWSFKLDLQERLGNKKITKNRKDMTLTELSAAIRDVRAVFPDMPQEQLKNQRLKAMIEANKRISLALSCFGFTVLGIPLGLNSKRKESSAGIGISLGLVFLFYFFIILAESLTDYPQYQPDLIVWIPVFFSQALGFLLLRRVV